MSNIDIEAPPYAGPDRRKIKWHEHERVSWMLIAAILLQAATGLWWLRGLSDEVKHLAESSAKRFATLEERVSSHWTNGFSRTELEAMFALRDTQMKHHSDSITEIKGSLRAIESGVHEVQRLVTKHATEKSGGH